MKAPIRVVSEEDFQKWLTPRQQKNAGTASPVVAPSPAKAATLTEPSTKNTL
jgi:heme/copper-type cytochrome/quinol oxidase subunit 2